MNKNKITIMIVEDNKLVRTGLKTLFNETNDFIVTAEAQYGREAVDKAKRLKPDVILMDIYLPDISGIKATQAILEYNPDSKIIIITANLTEDNINNSMSSGVFGLVCKDVNTEFLLFIIKSVSHGAIWLDPKVAEFIHKSNTFPNKIVSRSKFRASHNNLTSREYEVLKLVVDGKSNHEIADILCISDHTAKAHVCNIIQKLLVDDRTQAAVKAIKEGIV